LRGKPTTRNPYNERAAGKSVKEVEKTWESLKKHVKNPLATQDIASTIYIGAQDANAEKIPFMGRIDENFLLHFWQVVIRVFVPEIWKIDDKNKSNKAGKSDFKGYVLAIPDVCDLEGFVDEFTHMMFRLKPDIKGYRPAEAVISVPQEGALEYIAALARNKALNGAIAYNVSSVEIVHLEKRKNNINMLLSSRVPVDDTVRLEYESIRRGNYFHPLFKLQLIRNLLDGKEWYSCFDRLFSLHDSDWFLGSKSWFPIDAKKHFKLVNQEH